MEAALCTRAEEEGVQQIARDKDSCVCDGVLVAYLRSHAPSCCCRCGRLPGCTPTQRVRTDNVLCDDEAQL